MRINLVETGKVCLAEIISDAIILNDTQDAVDLIANCYYQGATGIMIREENVTHRFFDLKTRVAGDMLQKFSTYQSRLAIIGDFAKFTGKSFKDFMRESNRIGHINFVPTRDEAIRCLQK